MQAKTFFSASEQEAIAAAVREVESRTAGEIAVMVVDRSDNYPEARLLAAVLAGGVAVLGLTDRFFDDSLWSFIPLAAMAAAGFFLALRNTPAPLRAFIPAARLEKQVQERAVQSFYEKGLHLTRDRTGVLFFISIFEHRVRVLADAGIYAKISPPELQEYADETAAAIRRKQAAATLCAEIGRLGVILAEHFPVKAGDTNELRDEVITG